MKLIAKHPVILVFSAIIGLCLIALAGRFFWEFIQPQPNPTDEMIFNGVEYIRDVRNSPREIVIHIIKVDLKAEGIHTLVTQGDPQADLPVKARTTSSFLVKNGLQVAINGDGFTPWHSNNILDTYPKTGDPVDPIGIAISQGVRYSSETDQEPTLYISAINQARFNVQIGKIYNAISGNRTLVRNGKVVAALDDELLNPRTAIALDRASRHLILIAVDGRQPGYSEGVTLVELAQIILHHGGYNAINLDGGGSTTMVIEGAAGRSKVLNSPINNSIPGRQRPVGNHLGIYAKPLDD